MNAEEFFKHHQRAENIYGEELINYFVVTAQDIEAYFRHRVESVTDEEIAKFEKEGWTEDSIYGAKWMKERLLK